MKALLESGVHFGHRTNKWNPLMRPYIFTERNGIYIIDLQKTVKKLDEAYNFVRDTVVYTGTHDNPTLQQWFATLSPADQLRAHTYLNNWWTPPDQLHWDFIVEALRSVADTCIVPMPDYLGLGAEGRINTPSTSQGNWTWRMTTDAFTPDLVSRIASLTSLVERSDP